MVKNKFPSQRISTIAAVVALVVLTAVLTLSRGAAQSMPQPQPEPPADPQVQKLDLLLQRADLSDETRQMLQEKRIMAERMALESVDPDPRPVEERGPKLPPPLAEPLMVDPTQALWEGIFSGSQGLVRPSAAQVNNGWQGSRAGADFQVFAGSTPVEPIQGVLLVAQVDDDAPTASREIFLAPGAASLTILEVQDTLLLLETETGERLYFDLIARQFQPAQ